MTNEMPEELQPDKIRELELKCPDIVEFLRRSSQLGSAEADAVSQLVHRQEQMAKAMLMAIEGRVPVALAMTILNYMKNEQFREGLSMHVGFPDQIRDFVKRWMAEQGCYFEYMEPKK